MVEKAWSEEGTLNKSNVVLCWLMATAAAQPQYDRILLPCCCHSHFDFPFAISYVGTTTTRALLPLSSSVLLHSRAIITRAGCNTASSGTVAATTTTMLRHARLLRACRSSVSRAPSHYITATPLRPSTWSCSLCRTHTPRLFATSSDASSTSVIPSSTRQSSAPNASDPWSNASSPSSLLPAELRTGDADKDRATLRSLAARAARAEQDEEQQYEDDDNSASTSHYSNSITQQQQRLKLPPNHDLINDELTLPEEEDDPELPKWDPSNTAFPLPPLPPLPANTDFLPSYTPAYHTHRSGSSIDCFKHSMLLQLYGEMTEAYSTAITYVGVGGGGGGVATDISGSLMRQSGVDCVYEYGRWWARLARRTHDTVKHSLIPLMQAVRAVNGGSKLDRGFRYYPGNAAVIRHAMRPHDRAVFFEHDKQLARQLVEYFNNEPKQSQDSAVTNAQQQQQQQPAIPPLRAERADKAKNQANTAWALHNRVVVHPFNGFSSSTSTSSSSVDGSSSDKLNPVVALGRPLTSHALFHFDLTKERYENVRHMQQRLGDTILPQLFNQFPNATFVTSVPLYGDTLPFDVVRWHLRGHRDVMMVRFSGQQAVRLRDDEEADDRRGGARGYDDDDDMEDDMEAGEEEVEERNERLEKRPFDDLDDDDMDELDEQSLQSTQRQAAGEEDEDEDDLFNDEANDGAVAGETRGGLDGLIGSYTPFGGPHNTSIPIDEPWGVAMIIVKPPRGFDAVAELVQDDMADVRAHIPHVGLVHVSEQQLNAQEDAAGDSIQRSEADRQAILDEVVGQMRRFEEPDYVWLTPRHSDEGIDYGQALDWYNDSNIGNVSMMQLAAKQQAARRGKAERLDESQPGYYNDSKLVADMARPYQSVLGGGVEVGKKGKRRAAAAAAAAREQLVADKEERAAGQRDVDVHVSDEVKRTTERVHDNEGKLLEAWKREMAQRTQRQQQQQQSGQVVQ